jgi:hypothetical protein
MIGGSRRQKLRTNAADLYRRYRRDGDPSPILRFVRSQLVAGSGDVVHDLLLHLADQTGKERDVLLRRIVMAPTWQRFARTLEPLETHRPANS